MSNPNKITLEKGEYRVERLTFTDVDTGLPLNLTDATIYVTTRMGPTSADVEIWQKTSADDIAIDADPMTGIALLTIYPLDTSLLGGKTCYYDVWVVDVLGHPQAAIPPTPFVVTETLTVLP